MAWNSFHVQSVYYHLSINGKLSLLYLTLFISLKTDDKAQEIEKNVTDQEQRYLKYMCKSLYLYLFLPSLPFSWKIVIKMLHLLLLWCCSANLEELQAAEARQASSIEMQLEELKEKCQEKQNKVEEARYDVQRSIYIYIVFLCLSHFSEQIASVFQ